MHRLIPTCAAVLLISAAAIAQLASGRIDIAEFRKLHGAKQVLVVDVRDSDSFANGHIPGAINIPLGDEEQKLHFNALKAEKRPIVTYCA
jgi:rhodanese-related sulfurtransferase